MNDIKYHHNSLWINFRENLTDDDLFLIGLSKEIDINVMISRLANAYIELKTKYQDSQIQGVNIYQATIRKDTLLDEALEKIETIQDEGPYGEGWKSDELLDLITRIRKEVGD